jgi:2-polyprenyl-3-methyl-5-hydroxy-6-metoxy-1,4-benzoquinol methylase
VRFGVVAEGLAEWLALRLDLVPTPLADGVFAMMACRALMAGLDLGLIDRLAAGPASADELAERLALDPIGTLALVEALASGGYLERIGSRYRLARRARRWLDPGRTGYVGNLIRFNHDHWRWWSELEAVLRSGEPVEIHRESQDDAARRRYVLGMRDLAGLVAGEVVESLRPPRPPRRLLDIGGSHGRYAAAFCRRYPRLTATVLDLPPVVEIGTELIQATGLSGRIEFRAGDARHGDLGSGYDIVLLFDLLHHLPARQAREIVGRAVAALAPGGLIAILEPVRSRRPSQLAALLHLHYVLASRGGVPEGRWRPGWPRPPASRSAAGPCAGLRACRCSARTARNRAPVGKPPSGEERPA